MNKYILLTIAATLLVVLIGCGGGSGDPPRWDLCQTASEPPVAEHVIPTTDQLVVYLDTSASMAGYVSPNGKSAFSVAPDGNTVFSNTLLELRNVVTTLSPQPKVVVRKVDTRVSTPSYSDLDLSEAAISRSIYTGKETNLAGAIKTFSERLAETGDAHGDGETAAPPRFHILVTDGVQSSDESKVGVECSKGSDSFCVKKQLLELINSGWGGAILGLRSEFQGNVYSEVAHTAVNYASGKTRVKFRPFYLYVFSPDRAALDGLVGALRQRLAPLMPDEGLREYALTANYSAGPGSIEIAQEKQTKELLEVRQAKIKEGEMPRITVKAGLDTASKGVQQFVLTMSPVWSSDARAAGSADEMSGMIKWELRSSFPEKEDAALRYPVFNLVKQEMKDGKVELTFETGWDKAPGDTAWRMYHLIGRLDVDKPAPPWVSYWTTNLDTTVETANKTLNIESSLAGLWKNSAFEGHPIAEACIRVGEK